MEQFLRKKAFNLPQVAENNIPQLMDVVWNGSQ
jgi:hypothetical protein